MKNSLRAGAIILMTWTAGVLWAESPAGGNPNSPGGANNSAGVTTGLSSHDQSQISGNLNGDGNDNPGGFQKTEGGSKVKPHSSGGGAGKTKFTGSSVKGPTSGNGGMWKHKNGKGESKDKSHGGGGGTGKAQITGNSALIGTKGEKNGIIVIMKKNGDKNGNGLKKANTFQKQNSFSKANGMTKPGMADGSALPAVQPAH
jgi:hypothetical protein